MANDEYSIEMRADLALMNDGEPTPEELEELNAYFDRIEAENAAALASFGGNLVALFGGAR